MESLLLSRPRSMRGVFADGPDEQSNVSASLAVMVSSGAFEKMPQQGSITAKDLGALVNIEPNVIGL